MRTQMLRTVNRVLLALAGLALLASGLAALAGSLDLFDRWNVGQGSGWPWAQPGDVLLTDDDRTRWRSEGWWWPVVLAALAVLLLLALWWLLAQLRRRRLGAVRVTTPGPGGAENGEEPDDGRGALLRGRALENVLAAEARTLEGVDRARVRLLGRRTAPHVRVGLLLAGEADPGAVVEGLRTGALEHARTSAGLDRLPAEVRLRSVRRRAERVS